VRSRLRAADAGRFQVLLGLRAGGDAGRVEVLPGLLGGGLVLRGCPAGGRGLPAELDKRPLGDAIEEAPEDRGRRLLLAVAREPGGLGLVGREQRQAVGAVLVGGDDLALLDELLDLRPGALEPQPAVLGPDRLELLFALGGLPLQVGLLPGRPLQLGRLAAVAGGAAP